MQFERPKFEPVAQRVIAFSNARFYGENFSLRQTQLTLLNSLDAIIQFKNELRDGGSPVFDAVSLYHGMRSGHSTLWSLVAAALDPEVLIVYPSRDIARHHIDNGGGIIPNVRHHMTERELFSELTQTHSEIPVSAVDGKPVANEPVSIVSTRRDPKKTFPYSIVIFDYAGIWHYHKSPDWSAKFRVALRGLEERQVLTILA